MTTEPKCLPGCRTIEAAPFNSDHLPGCPTAEALKMCARECRCDTCDGEGGHLPTDHNYRAAFHAPNCPKYALAPAPEPVTAEAAQSCVCGDPAICHGGRNDECNKCDCQHYEAARPAPEPKQVCAKPQLGTVEPLNAGQIVAIRAEVDRLKQDAARHEEEEAANCPEDQSCVETIKALRAQLAEKEQMVAWKQGLLDEVSKNFDIERAARERAEVLLPDLLAVIKQPSRHGLNWKAVDQAEAILARAKEGEKR